MKKHHIYHNGERGFALITAIMMLFAATVMGLMVMNSSEIEILLSGAQQRYESNFNTAEGASGVEAATVGTMATVVREINGTEYSRSYAVSNPSVPDQVLSPDKSTDPMFDPGNDMTLPAAEHTVTANENTDLRSLWPTDNLLQSDLAADNSFDYQYRTVYLHDGPPPKGYGVEDFSGYLFQMSAHRTTLIEMGGNKVGPKLNL